MYATLSDLVSHLKPLRGENHLAEWLFDGIKALVARVKVIRPDFGEQPYHGIITEHPVFAALAAQPVSEGERPPVRRLQALYLMAAADRELLTIKHGYISPLQTAGLACRRLSQNILPDKHRNLILSCQTPESLYDRLKDLSDKITESRKDSDGEKAYYYKSEKEALLHPITETMLDMITLLHDVREDRGLRTRPIGGSDSSALKAPTTKLVRTAQVGQSQPHTQRAPAIDQSLLVDSPTQEARIQMKEEGLTPTDTSRAALYLARPRTRNPDYSLEGMTGHQAGLRIALRARAYVASQQMVPSRTDTLHSPALQVLACLPQYLRGAHSANNPAIQLLASLLLLGCDLEELRDLRVWTTRDNVPDDPEAGGIVLQSQEFVLSAPPVPDGWRPLPEDAEKHRAIHKQLFLPIPTYLPIGRSLFDYAAKRPVGLLFDPRLNIKRTLKKNIKELNDHYSLSLSASRISDHLRQAVYMLDGDMAEAIFLSSRLRKSNDARLYYSAPQRKHLAEQYQRVWLRTAGQAGLAVEAAPTIPEQPGSVGSAAVPHRVDIVNTIRHFKQKTQQALSARGRRSKEQWVKAHNLLTAYVVIQIQWLTGIRAVRDPVELELYDPSSGFLGVIDKDSDDQYGARVVWLSDPVRSQVERYMNYIKNTTHKILGQVEPSAAFRLIEPDKLTVTVLDRAALASHFPGNSYVANAHRHYFRTRMREFGVDAGFIDAWLGHGGQGNEPYARFSAISPQEMKNVMRPALDQLWSELGWSVLPEYP